MTTLYGSVEAGGTKFVCAVGDETFTPYDKIQFPTTSPEETIQKTIDYFKTFEEDLVAISVGSLGPLILTQVQLPMVISQVHQNPIGQMLICLGQLLTHYKSLYTSQQMLTVQLTGK